VLVDLPQIELHGRVAVEREEFESMSLILGAGDFSGLIFGRGRDVLGECVGEHLFLELFEPALLALFLRAHLNIIIMGRTARSGGYLLPYLCLLVHLLLGELLLQFSWGLGLGFLVLFDVFALFT